MPRRPRGEALGARASWRAGSTRPREDAEGARLRVEEAGLIERLGEAVEEYAVPPRRSRLVEETLALYERDRQPAIVQRAAEAIFETMTDGRYPHVVTPLGSFALSVRGRGEPDEGRREAVHAARPSSSTSRCGSPTSRTCATRTRRCRC